ncbi:MAG: outer membrane protein assembly factor BamC [Sideroxydans sp.]|nr:outer membrane protein assembly factor BamC [Sideroxydans sp.]
MKTLHIAVITTCLLAIAGCQTLGIEKKRVDYKSAATRAPSLEVPPDLTVPAAEDRYAIPEGNGESVESYSDYAKGGSGQPAYATGNVLPPVKGAQLEKNGAQRWLEVDGPAESVWPKVKAFWQQNGFAIKSENPQAGVMETDWAENRADIPEGGIRSMLGKVFSDVYDSGTRDRYLTRLERSKDGKSTEVYITHYGMQEVLTGADKDSSKWEPRPRDPALEASMLQMMLASMGGSDAGTAGSAVAGDGTQPVLQRLSDGSTAIVLNQPFDRSWRQVELALEQAGIAVDDKDRANGVLYLRPVKKEEGILDSLEFWKSEDDKQPSRMQVSVHQDATGCVVTVSTAEGGSNADTQRVIDTLYQNMGTQTSVASGGSHVVAAAALPYAPPKLQGSGNSKTILLSASMDRCWNDVQMALERAEMKPVDTDRPNGKLYLPAADRDQEGSWFNRLAFWKSGDIKMARPEVVVREVAGGCEVSANDGNGGTNEATQHIIDTLYQNLSQ